MQCKLFKHHNKTYSQLHKLLNNDKNSKQKQLQIKSNRTEHSVTGVTYSK